jgi:phosphoribosylformylglycinamidine synthase
MTENFSTTEPDLQQMFAEGKPFPLEVIDLWAEGATPLEVLKLYNKDRGLALDQLEVSVLVSRGSKMFFGANSV